MILADTDVLIDFLAGVEPTSSVVKRLVFDEQLRTSAVNSFELLTGAKPGKKGDSVRSLVSLLDIIPIDRVAADKAAGMRQNLKSQGLDIGMADCLIAGIALTNGFHLLTRNKKHFERIPGLTLVPL